MPEGVGERKSPLVAFLLSVLPGAGHLYVGRMGSGIRWLVMVFFAYQVFDSTLFIPLVLHFFCGSSAAQAAGASNRAESRALQARRESASEFAGMLDGAVVAEGPSPRKENEKEETDDPPPRIIRAAFSVPPDRLVAAVAEAMSSLGLQVHGVDTRHHRVRATDALPRVGIATLLAQVEATPSGSRVRMVLDRPPGTPRDPDADDARLRQVLETAEGLLAGASGSGAPAPGAVLGEGAALDELDFLEQLREAWESYEQGWLPEDEWRKHKAGLIGGITLRPDTRPGDFLSACRPLVEAGVMDGTDLRALEIRFRG